MKLSEDQVFVCMVGGMFFAIGTGMIVSVKGNGDTFAAGVTLITAVVATTILIVLAKVLK